MQDDMTPVFMGVQANPQADPSLRAGCELARRSLMHLRLCLIKNTFVKRRITFCV